MASSVKKTAAYLSLGAAGLILAACQRTPPRIPPAPAEKPPLPAVEVLPPKAAAMNTIDDYKILVAQQILDANAPHTFSGNLPPMLPAIVVLNLRIDKDGELIGVEVKRSRNSEASKVALAAVRRAGPGFAKPQHLLRHGHKTLDFSETFLFNDKYQFQLRTLAGPQ